MQQNSAGEGSPNCLRCETLADMSRYQRPLASLSQMYLPLARRL